MRRLLLVVGAFLLITACAPTKPTLSKPLLFVFRANPAALVEIDSTGSALRQMPVTIPDGCGLGELHAAPRGSVVALELSCAFGQAVVTVDTDSGAMRQPITDSDSHFLAWSNDGGELYLKVNSINRPQIVRVRADGTRETVPVSELTYDLAPRPAVPGSILFAMSRGMGLGSELWLLPGGPGGSRQLLSDPSNYISLARWSPDGTQIAFIKIPDSPTPFTVGELWVIRTEGTDGRLLAQADAGHGFAPVWSPDGRQIAFVYRENAADPNADQAAEALVSNLHVINLSDGSDKPLTEFRGARVEAPQWQPDGNLIALTVVANDRMNAYLLDVSSGNLQRIAMDSTCCGVWIRK